MNLTKEKLKATSIMYPKKPKKEFERKSKPTSLGSALDNMFDAYNIRDKFDKADIESSWEEIMGKPVADRTSKIFLKDHKLFIRLTSSPLAQELAISKQKILTKFAERFGEGKVVDLVFI